MDGITHFQSHHLWWKCHPRFNLYPSTQTMEAFFFLLKPRFARFSPLPRQNAPDTLAGSAEAWQQQCDTCHPLPGHVCVSVWIPLKCCCLKKPQHISCRKHTHLMKKRSTEAKLVKIPLLLSKCSWLVLLLQDGKHLELNFFSASVYKIAFWMPLNFSRSSNLKKERKHDRKEGKYLHLHWWIPWHNLDVTSDWTYQQTRQGQNHFWDRPNQPWPSFHQTFRPFFICFRPQNKIPFKLVISTKDKS